MVDNYAFTPGSGGTGAADDIGGVLHQRVKLIHGADGVNDGDVASANPLPVYTPTPVNRSVTPTVTAGAYTTGMVVGGKLSITNAVRVSGGSGAIQSVSVSKRTALEAFFDVLFFHTDPAASTFTDHAALSLAQADFARRIGVVRLTDLVDCGTPRIVQANNLFLPFTLATGTSLFAVPVIRGAETYASTDAVELSVGIIRY